FQMKAWSSSPSGKFQASSVPLTSGCGVGVTTTCFSTTLVTSTAFSTTWVTTFSTTWGVGGAAGACVGCGAAVGGACWHAASSAVPVDATTPRAMKRRRLTILNLDIVDLHCVPRILL